MMKILHLSAFDTSGGASMAAYRLHLDLKKSGLDSFMLVQKKHSTDDEVIEIWSDSKKYLLGMLSNRLNGFFARFFSPNSSMMWSFPFFPSFFSKLERMIRDINPDVINLHWINNSMISFRQLARLSKKYPIVWTMHDMWALSTGYHYLGDQLERFRISKGVIMEDKIQNNFISNFHYNSKTKFFSKSKTRVSIIAPSVWMYEYAKQSELGKYINVFNIPYSVPVEVFKPCYFVDEGDGKDVSQEVGKELCNVDLVAFARNRFSLPIDKKLILFGSEFSSTDMRKGIDLLMGALDIYYEKIYKGNNTESDIPEIVVFGNSESKPKIKPKYFKCHFLGKFSDEVSLSLLYSACDCFACPSREDNLPNTVLESLACNVPVIAFDIGGMPDMITHMTDGYLVKPFDLEDFSNGLNFLLNKYKNDLKSPRNKILNKFNSSNQVKSYNKIYKKLLQ